MPDKKTAGGHMPAEPSPEVNPNEFDINVLSYIAITLPGAPEVITKINSLGFRYYIGWIKDTENTEVVDTILQHQRYPHMVIGIKTMIKPPYFRLVWKLRQEYDDVIEANEVRSINDAFETVYRSLVRYFPCVLINSKTQPYKIIYDDKHNVFVVDLTSYRGAVYSKLAVQKQKYQPIERSECVNDTVEVKFNVDGVVLTVKQYVYSRYLIELFKLIRIFQNSQKS